MATKKKSAKKQPARKAAKKVPAKALKKAAPKLKPRKQPESLRIRTIAPGFTVSDIAKSLAWYTTVLGFVIIERWEHEGKLLGASLRAGTATLMLGQDDWKLGRDRKKGVGVRLYCSTAQDVDMLAAGIKLRGGVLDHEPENQPWGARDFGVTDPDGYKLTIST